MKRRIGPTASQVLALERMDVEKTIQFLTENAAAHDVRLATIERAVLSLTDIVRDLAQKTDERFRQTDERFRQTDERFRQTDERVRQLAEKTDERIAALVSAIGKLIPKSANGTSPD